jgi:hypothetical protein
MDNHGPTRRNEGHCIGLAKLVAQVIVLIGIPLVILYNLTESAAAENVFPLPAATAPFKLSDPPLQSLLGPVLQSTASRMQGRCLADRTSLA